MNTQLVTQLKAIFGNVGSEVAPLLAVYATGDHMKGRPLWNSPVELALIVDAEEPPRFPPRDVVLLPEPEFSKIKRALAGLEFRMNYRLSRLAQRRGTIALYQERNTSFLHYYHILQAVVGGVRLYHASDFLLDDFERDLRKEWETDDEKRQNASAEVLKHAFNDYHLPPVDEVKFKRLDIIYTAELLKQLREALNNTYDMRTVSLEIFTGNFNIRNRIRQGWRNSAMAIAELGRHVISRETTHTPNNYTQLLDHLADLGVVEHKQVEGLTAMCEHPMLRPIQRTCTDEDVEVYYLMSEYITCADHFAAGMVGYLHRMVH